MKFNQQLQVQMLSRLSLYDRNVLLEWMKLQCDMLPDMTPTKYQIRGTPRKLFHMERFIQHFMRNNGNFYSLEWTRAKKTRAIGTFEPSLRRVWDGLPMHAEQWISSELNQTNIEELIAYMKVCAVQFKTDLSYIDYCTLEYFGNVIYPQKDFVNHDCTPSMYVCTRDLRYWLNDINWVTIFGDAYVRLFGMEKLLSAPAYKVEKLNEETVFIQLTENVHDVIDDFAEMQRIRKAVKEHLDPDAFFHIKKAFKRPACYTDEVKQLGRCPVFNTPDFVFLDDAYSLRFEEMIKDAF